MTAHRSTPASSQKILIVDDNADLRMLLGLALRNAGYEVDLAGNGIEGLQKYRAGTWDLVVTDLEMPEMSGEQMTARIKALEPEIPVILVTGVPGLVTHPALFEGIYPKPYTAAIICGAVSDVLSHLPIDDLREESMTG